MKYENIVYEWKKSSFRSPNVFILKNSGNFFAVVEDHTTIIIVVSKSGITYAIAKNKVFIDKNEYGFPIYLTDDSDNLKNLHCTGASLSKRHPDQFFVNEKIIQYI
jgi:hypothetical protein